MLLVLVWMQTGWRPVHAYPILFQIEEDTERCFQFQIPPGDDAHFVGVVLPSTEDMQDGAVEAWYFEQVYRLMASKHEKQIIGKQFLDEPPPDFVANHRSDYWKSAVAGIAAARSNTSPVTVSLSNRPFDRHGESQYTTKLFQPLVINFVARTTSNRANRKGMGVEEDIDGYSVCIHNKDEESSWQFVLDIVLLSDDLDLHLLNGDEAFSKDRHLTPLEASLEDSINAAHTVLHEMQYMELREQRMKVTTDSINSRVHWFSYLSISVLLAVTYVQVSYLKRYFHKKKLM